MIDVFIEREREGERERERERKRERKHASSDILTRIVLDETNRKEIIEQKNQQTERELLLL
jgi:hypothetical protein